MKSGSMFAKEDALGGGGGRGGKEGLRAGEEDCSTADCKSGGLTGRKRRKRGGKTFSIGLLFRTGEEGSKATTN